MIRTWKKIGAGMILCIFMAGCGSQNEVYLETEVSQDTGNVQETEETEAGERLVKWIDDSCQIGRAHV